TGCPGCGARCTAGGRRRNRPTSDRGGRADLSEQPTVAHELPGVPSHGTADHVQPHRINDQAGEPEGEREREVLDRTRGRSTLTTSGRSTQRHGPDGSLLDPPRRASQWDAQL